MDHLWLNAQFTSNPQKSKAELARALGLEPSAVSKILKGTRQIKANEYNIMRKFFGLPTDGDQTAIDPEKSFVIKPLGRKDGLSEKQTDQGEWIMPASLVAQYTSAPPEKIKIFQVTESLMEPDFRKGEHVIVDMSDTKPNPPGVFIVSDGFGTLVRQCDYIPNSKPPKIRISATQKNFQPQILRPQDFNIIGRVIAKLQWL